MDRKKAVTKYGDADGYDAYMGGWSAALAPSFVAFAGVSDGTTVLDVGCGTGNLLASVSTALPRSHLFGVDPSPALLSTLR